MVKNLPAVWETQVRSLGWKDPLEKEMATHCSILAWRSPWIEEPGGLQSMGSQRVSHNWVTNTFTLSHSVHWVGLPCSSIGKESACNARDPGSIPGLERSLGEGNGYTLQYSCLENPLNRGAWWASVHDVTKSRTWLSNRLNTVQYTE